MYCESLNNRYYDKSTETVVKNKRKKTMLVSHCCALVNILITNFAMICLITMCNANTQVVQLLTRLLLFDFQIRTVLQALTVLKKMDAKDCFHSIIILVS